MRKNFGREIALLCLPVLIFGGAALWNKWAPRDQNEPPAGIERGAPRVEWNGFRAAKVTSAEIGLGLTAKLETTLWSGGEIPAAWRRVGFLTNYGISDQKLRLVYRQNKRWEAYLAADGTSGIRRQLFREEPAKNSSAPTNWRVSLYLPLAALPRDASDVHLKGQWLGRWLTMGKAPLPPAMTNLARWDGNGWEVKARSRPFDVPLASIRDLDARIGEVPDVSRVPSVTLLKAQMQLLAQDIENQSTMSAAGDAGIFLHVSAPKGRWRNKNNWPKILQYRLSDSAGRDWTKGAEESRESLSNTNLVGWSAGGGLPDGEFILRSQLAMDHIPSSAGAVRLKIWITDDSQSWPLVIEQEVRPQWAQKRTSNLKIESVRLAKRREVVDFKYRGNEAVDIYAVWPKIEIVVRYLGPKRPVPRGFTRQGQREVMKEFWEWLPHDPYRELQFRPFTSEQMPITARDEDLIFHWSQRVEKVRGKVLRRQNGRSSWESVIGAPDRPKHLDRQGKRWLVSYDLSGLPRHKKGETWTFRAEFGIAGEGFLPVEFPLPAKAPR